MKKANIIVPCVLAIGFISWQFFFHLHDQLLMQTFSSNWLVNLLQPNNSSPLKQLVNITANDNVTRNFTKLTTNLSQSANIFIVEHPDYSKSPFTGMSRRHWIEAGVYLLKGAFRYVKTIEDPVALPKQPGKSYPRNLGQEPTAKLEAMVRTLLIAAPLLKDNPRLMIGQLPVADYYRRQIARMLDPSSQIYVPLRKVQDGHSQTLVEFGGLSLSLFVIPEILWDPLTSDQKEFLKRTMLSYGEGPTLTNNWRFFNILILSFFKSRGYSVNETSLELYLDAVLEAYVGEGWYADGTTFDYYSMWAFQLYGVLWSQYFGFKYYPKYAERFMANFGPLKHNYPHMFSRNGEMIMWGRSISYRFAAVSPLPFTGYQKDSSTNYGWLRRIASGTLLQFLQHPKYLQDGVPTLGFYGAFEPAVQDYNCRGSVYWAGKAFLGLLLPETNPYWSSVENEGPWAKLDNVANRFGEGSKILITNYPSSGASEIRVRCCPNKNYLGHMTLYNRLAYNSAFAWQEDGNDGEVSMNYLVRTGSTKQWELIQQHSFVGYNAGVYRRSAQLERSKLSFQLTDVILPHGVLRIDMVRGSEPADIRLGHYALPQLEVPMQVDSKFIGRSETKIISNGKYSLAMCGLGTWQAIETKNTQGLNPSAERSTLIMLSDHFDPLLNEGVKIYASVMLWKLADVEWTLAELEPVKTVNMLDGNVLISLSNGTIIKISIF